MPSDTATDAFRYALQTDLLKLYAAVGLGLAAASADPFVMVSFRALRNVLTLALHAGGLLVAVAGVVGTLRYVLVDSLRASTGR